MQFTSRIVTAPVGIHVCDVEGAKEVGHQMMFGCSSVLKYTEASLSRLTA